MVWNYEDDGKLIRVQQKCKVSSKKKSLRQPKRAKEVRYDIIKDVKWLVLKKEAEVRN